MDRLLSLEVFVKTVEYGSLTAAGEVMGMSSQVMGKHLKALETHFKLTLINRTTRKQHLTDAGESFYIRAKNILAELQSLETDAASIHGEPMGILRVNAPITFGIHALSAKLPRYLAKFPKIDIELTVSNNMVDLYQDGYDAIIRVGQIAESNLVSRKLAPYKLTLCASPDYVLKNGFPLILADLKGHNCLGFSYAEQMNTWSFIDNNERNTVQVKGRIITNSGEALLQIALAGGGIILQPDEMVKPLIASGRLVELLPSIPATARPLNILFAKDKRMTPKLRSFIDFIVAEFS